MKKKLLKPFGDTEIHEHDSLNECISKLEFLRDIEEEINPNFKGRRAARMDLVERAIELLNQAAEI